MRPRAAGEARSIQERDKARAEYVHQQAKRVTFDECASAYISAHRGICKSAKHAVEDHDCGLGESHHRRAASGGGGHGPRRQGAQAHLDHEDRDGHAPALTRRVDPRLGYHTQISSQRKSGPLARAPREPARQPEQDRAGQEPSGAAVA